MLVDLQKNQEVCYWKGLVARAERYAKLCKICQQFKKRNNIYGHLPPKNIAELNLWDTFHVELIRPYSKSIRHHNMGSVIIKNNFSLTCMTMIGLV